MKNLLEDLAALEHKQWAHWTEYMLNRIEGIEKANLNPKQQIEDWRRQIKTKYQDLTEKEKDSDRVWARKTIEIILKHIAVENPYYDDVLLPRSSEEMKEIAEIIKKELEKSKERLDKLNTNCKNADVKYQNANAKYQKINKETNDAFSEWENAYFEYHRALEEYNLLTKQKYNKMS